MKLCFEKTLDMPFLAYYGCSKLLKARAVFYWGTRDTRVVQRKFASVQASGISFAVT